MGILATALVLLAFAAPARADMLTSLISHWKLNEASGTRVDSHGSNDLTDNNTVTQNPGKIGDAAQFTRANSEHLDIADNAALSFGDDPMSIVFWVYMDSKPGGLMGMVAKNVSEYYTDWRDTTDRFRFGAAGTIVSADTFGAPSTATWYMIYVYHDPTADEIGISVNDGTVDTAATSSGITDGTDDFNIGSVQGTSDYWDGRIDSVSIWDKVLASSEVTDLYNAGAGFDYPFGVGGGARSFGVIIYSASGGIPFGFPIGGLW
jgi:hypothetical protein